jgi:hypothetical protein
MSGVRFKLSETAAVKMTIEDETNKAKASIIETGSGGEPIWNRWILHRSGQYLAVCLKVHLWRHPRSHVGRLSKPSSDANFRSPLAVATVRHWEGCLT